MSDQATSSLSRPSITRHRTRVALVGGIPIGGGYPIVVQSMTNTDTADIGATVAQAKALADAGSELVRITVNTAEAAAAVPAIRERLDALGCKVPLIGDFHFNGHKLLSNFPDCARALAKYRINPGNVGKGSKHDPQFAVMIERAIDYGKPVRIGVNWGSLDQDLLTSLMDENAKSVNPLDAAQVTREALVTSALRSAQFAEALGLPGDRIVLSCKVSSVQDLIAVYTELARRCDYPLHLGLTEAGMGSKGIVASTAAMAVLLQQGIGDTIRVSLTPEPNGDRTREVIVAQEMLQTIGGQNSDELARADAVVAQTLSGCREHDRRRDGLRRQRTWRIENGEHRHQPPRYRRGTGGARVRRRSEDRHAQGRRNRRGIRADRRRLRARNLWRRPASPASQPRAEVGRDPAGAGDSGSIELRSRRRVRASGGFARR